MPSITMLVRALECRGVRSARSPLRHRWVRGLARIAVFFDIRRFHWLRSNDAVFCHLNHVWEIAFYPSMLYHPLVTYTFDCWLPDFDRWQRVFDLARPEIAFISSRQAVEEMRQRVPSVDFRWLPEAADPQDFYQGGVLAGRDIDVLEIGRSHMEYQRSVKMALVESGMCHRYPEEGGQIQYSREEMLSSLSRSKVLICFPRSITDPGKSGGVETTTMRYFEGILSKCLLVGKCPAELIEIMGYNPLIDVDMTRPAEQLLDDILLKIESFQEFVEMNYNTLIEKWTVKHQADIIRKALDEVEMRACRL